MTVEELRNVLLTYDDKASVVLADSECENAFFGIARIHDGRGYDLKNPDGWDVWTSDMPDISEVPAAVVVLVPKRYYD